MPSPNDRSFTIDPHNPRVEANRRLVESEILPGNTVTFSTPVDLAEIEEIRASAKRDGRIRPSYTAFVAKAIALGLQEFPYANRRLYKRPWWPFIGHIQRFHRCDVTIAAERDVEGAESVAFVDVLRDVDRLSLEEITTWLSALANSTEATNKQWREFSQVTRLPWFVAAPLLRLPLYFPSLWMKWRGGAAMISSPAKYGVHSVVATWPWPLGFSFGFVSRRPFVDDDGQIVVRTCFDLVLNFDRRIMAGAPAAKFFVRIIRALERAKTELENPRAGESQTTAARP